MELPQITTTDRIAFIEKYVRSKRVLHVGCADAPFTKQRLRDGTLLHLRLQASAGHLAGVDLSAESIGLMREAGIDNLHVANCEEPLAAAVPGRYDVVIAGETLEHVLNAGDFLASLRDVCSPSGVVLITTPNHASIKKNLRLLTRTELVHPEHVAYYSISTLTRLFDLVGLRPMDWSFYWATASARAKMVNGLLDRLPRMRYYADGICVACRPAT